MVIGIDKFRDHFAGYEEQYALIGGAACDLIFTDAGLEFRSTKDRGYGVRSHNAHWPGTELNSVPGVAVVTLW